MSDRYGYCKDCGLDMGTEVEANEHMQMTMQAAVDRRSHTIRVEKPSRKSEAQSAAWDAVSGALAGLADGGFTDDEIRSALAWIDLVDLWEETR